MRRATAVAFLALVVACGGCATSGSEATSPTRTWANQQDALTAFNIAFVAASNAGRLNDEQRIAVGELLMTAQAELNRARALLPAGGAAFDSYMAIVQTILAKAAEQQALRKAGQ